MANKKTFQKWPTAEMAWTANKLNRDLVEVLNLKQIIHKYVTKY